MASRIEAARGQAINMRIPLGKFWLGFGLWVWSIVDVAQLIVQATVTAILLSSISPWLLCMAFAAIPFVLAERASEYAAAATLAREMTEYARKHGLTRLAARGMQRQSELWERVAKATAVIAGSERTDWNSRQNRMFSYSCLQLTSTDSWESQTADKAPSSWKFRTRFFPQ